jgi:hypothetical protein
MFRAVFPAMRFSETASSSFETSASMFSRVTPTIGIGPRIGATQFLNRPRASPTESPPVGRASFHLWFASNQSETVVVSAGAFVAVGFARMRKSSPTIPAERDFSDASTAYSRASFSARRDFGPGFKSSHGREPSGRVILAR